MSAEAVTRMREALAELVMKIRDVERSAIDALQGAMT